MQNIYYTDINFVKENSTQYILSIRFSTDGLSFCIHDSYGKLMSFFSQPYSLDSQDEVIAKVKKAITEEELLKLKYKKVYILPCKRDKTLIPAHLFDKNYLADLYRICLHSEKNDVLLYRKIRIMEAYIAEALPRNFVTFLSSRYQSLCIVNSAYPFIINSLSGTLMNREHLFVDIHDRYFDLLISRSNEVLLFNSFGYNSVTDLIYYILNCLKHVNVNKNNLQTILSGNLVNDPQLTSTLGKYIPNLSVLNDRSLNQTLKNEKLNSSSFIHLLSMHKCE